MIEIQPDREAMRKFNVHADELNRLIETALAGTEVGLVIEGNKRSPIVVRLGEDRRSDLEGIKRLALRTEDGGMLALGQVAKIVLVPISPCRSPAKMPSAASASSSTCADAIPKASSGGHPGHP
jgi:Cu/Ag efflux pump CusA